MNAFASFSLSRRRLLGLAVMSALGTAPVARALAADRRLKIVTTLFPQYDFVRQIAGDRVDVSLLLKPGQEAHTYEPTPQDIKRIQAADLFIYVGGDNDDWVDDLLDSQGTRAPQTVRLIDLVATVAEEEVEGMEDDDHDHDHDDHDDKDDKDDDDDRRRRARNLDHHGESRATQERATRETREDDDDPDEHVWTSPKNAIEIVNALKDTLVDLDPAGKSVYEKNAAAYVKELQALDAGFTKVTKNAKRHTILVGDRFPFRYLTDAYGLNYHAAFPGCSTQVRPSAATVAFLVNKTKELKLPVVLKVANSSARIAESIAEPTGAKILALHAIHNLTPAEVKAGATYLSLMKENVEVLRQALN